MPGRENPDVERMLKALENTSEDELDLLASTGAAYYSTEQLYRLLGQWQVKQRLFRQFNALILWIAALSPAWLVLGVSGIYLSWRWLGLFFLSLFPLSMFLFFAGLIFMRRMFQNRGHLEQVGDQIIQELQKRQKPLL